MKSYLLGCLLGLPWLAAAQQPCAYSISGRLGPVPPATWVYMRDRQQLLDSALVRDGSFVLRGSRPQPQQVQLLLASGGPLAKVYRRTAYVPGDWLNLFIEPTPVVVTSPRARYQSEAALAPGSFKDQLNQPNILFPATVSGGPVNRDFQRYNVQVEALGRQLHPRREEPVSLDLNASRRESAAYNQLTRTFIQQNPASWVSLDLLHRRLGPAQYDATAPLYAVLSPELKRSPAGRAYGQLLDSLRTVALGAIAPNLTLTTPAGKPVTLQGYRGRYLLLQFWSSQCECRPELGSVTELCERYARRGLAALNVSLNEPGQRKQWLQRLGDHNLPGTPASNLDGAAGPTARRYRVEQLPQNFLLDPQGRILAVNLYGDDLAAQLAKVLPGPPR